MDRVTELLHAARDGNQHALDAFVRATEPDVRNLCRHLGDPDTVDDLVQDSYCRALRAMPRYRGDGNGRAWMLSIARYTCIDATRSRIRWRRRRDPRELPDTAVEDHQHAEVDDLLARLGPDRREAFVLTQMLGCSYADAATVIGCPVGTVRSRVARAREDLLGIITALDDTDTAQSS